MSGILRVDGMRPNFDKNMDGEFENRISENVPVTTISPFRNVNTDSVPTPKNTIPSGCHFSMDMDKTWWAYKDKPSICSDCWIGNHIAGSSEIGGTAWPDWKDSLFLMTENGLEKV